MANGINRPIILASQSPRRAALLREAGIPFEAVTPRYEEPAIGDWRFSAVELAEAAGYFKARSLAEQYPDHVILGADTVVALENRIFGKPADREDARRILSMLAGTTQDVITGVAILHPTGGRRLIQHDITHVTMRALSEAELEDYMDSGEWEGKAGAYGIQDRADAFVTRLEGSFSNVVGLPIERVRDMLKMFAVELGQRV